MSRNKTARQHNFAIVPAGDLPRSILPMRWTRKMGFNASELVPINCKEVLPGDTWEHREAIMARLATPIAPVLDDLALETFHFFVPCRLLHDDWEEFITGTGTPGLPKLIPTEDAGPVWDIVPGTVADHFGLPIGSYTSAQPVTAMPFTAYFEIFNKWFRHQDLQEEWDTSLPKQSGVHNWDDYTNAGGAIAWTGGTIRACKRHDYFTSSLPNPQKGAPVTIPLGTTAPVVSNGLPPNFEGSTWPGPAVRSSLATLNTSAGVQWSAGAAGATNTDLVFGNETGLEVDLATAASATINAIRLAVATQQLLERDARGGSRYVEQMLSHWKVRSPDFRLQNPEYLGGSYIPVTVNPIAQTAAYDAEPGPTDSAVGNLGASMQASGSKRIYNYSATEHGYLIGLAVVRATPTYQQGTARHWLRETRLDYYWPTFANLGEQAVETKEIFTALDGVYGNATWGYQERSAEYRYSPNEITGHLRSTSPTPMDWWHYGEEFASEPALNDEFIEDKTQETLARSLATAPNAQWACQIIMDVYNEARVARIMPAYSIPGIDRL